jgi:hypothetical protein
MTRWLPHAVSPLLRAVEQPKCSALILERPPPRTPALPKAEEQAARALPGPERARGLWGRRRVRRIAMVRAGLAGASGGPWRRVDGPQVRRLGDPLLLLGAQPQLADI